MKNEVIQAGQESNQEMSGFLEVVFAVNKYHQTCSFSTNEKKWGVQFLHYTHTVINNNTSNICAPREDNCIPNWGLSHQMWIIVQNHDAILTARL